MKIATWISSAFCALVPGGAPSTFIPGQRDSPFPSVTVYRSNRISTKEQAWVYNASLTQRFGDNLTADRYKLTSWRPGHQQPEPLGHPPGFVPDDDLRKSDNFEAGIKASAWG